MDYSVRERDGVPVIDIAGDLDKSAADMLEFALASLAVQGRTRIVLNLANVDFVCSTSLGMIGKFHRRLAAQQGCLVLLQPTENVQRVLTITRLADLLKIHHDEATAVAALRPPA